MAASMVDDSMSRDGTFLMRPGGLYYSSSWDGPTLHMPSIAFIGYLLW